METFDVLDCRGRKTGERITRDEAHRSGAWHGAFHCLILYRRGGRGYALFQRRSDQKKIAPGRFDVSVGGHYAAGEDAGTAGPREIKEELGLDVGYDKLVPVGRRIFVYCFTPGATEYEFQDVFLLPMDVRADHLKLQKEEVEAVLEMEIEAGLSLFGREGSGIRCTLFKNGAASQEIEVSAADFVPNLDNYYLKLLLLAKRYLRGERTLLFI